MKRATTFLIQTTSRSIPRNGFRLRDLIARCKVEVHQCKNQCIHLTQKYKEGSLGEKESQEENLQESWESWLAWLRQRKRGGSLNKARTKHKQSVVHLGLPGDTLCRRVWWWWWWWCVGGGGGGEKGVFSYATQWLSTLKAIRRQTIPSFQLQRQFLYREHDQKHELEIVRPSFRSNERL